ncbi:MAG: tetratricopeptide repeat protein, partial [Actinomycetota bacterium]
GGGALRLRAGVTNGRVYAGEFGPPFRRTFSVKGDAVNLAARLMARAGEAEVYAAESVLAQARTAYATELLPPLLVKGKLRPVTVHRVKRALGADASAPRFELPFAGREQELSDLWSALETTRLGTGQVWEISGEAGIGKSRLLAEFTAGIAGAAVLRVECDQYHSTTPYAPFRRLLRRLTGIAEDADAEAAGRMLLDVVHRAAPSLLPWTPLLAAVLDASVAPTAEADALEATFRKTRQEEQAVRLLETLVPGPLVLLIEDAHLMDEASVDLLSQIAVRSTERSWLVVTTTRTSVDGGPVSELVSYRMRLAPLDVADVESVVKRATEETPMSPYETSMLVRRAGGNPLFVQELLAATRAGSTLAALPDSIEGLIAVQVDALQPLERRVLRVASVLGMRIERQVLDEVLLAEGLSGEALRGSLRGFLDADGETLRFRHTLVRDTAYEGLPYSRRMLLHGLAGAAIERNAGDRANNAADLLSLHFLHARNFDAAWRYACVAADRAREVHAQVEAAEFYERALDAAKGLGRSFDPQAARVTEALGDARYKLGEFPKAAAAYRSSRALSASEVDLARLCYKCSLVADRTGHYRNALAWLSRAQRLLQVSTDDAAPRLRAECRAQYGLIRHWQGRDVDAAGALREAVSLAEHAAADDAVATALVWLDNCEMTLGTSASGEHALRALAIWRRMGNHPWEEARVLNQLGIRAYFEGRWDLAVDFYSQSKDACARAGDQFTDAVESGNMAEVLSDQGRLTEAEPLLREALRVWRAAGAPSFVAFGKSQLGRLAARDARFGEALELLNSARSDYSRDGEHAEVLESDARLAECLLLKGDFRTALKSADAALEGVTSARRTLPQVPLLQRVRGLALAHVGEYDAALDALALSLQGAHERGARHEAAWTMQAISEVHRAAGMPGDEDMSARQLALFEQLGIVSVAGPGWVGAG